MPKTISGLSALAQLYGVQTSYYDISRRRQSASPEALLAVLRALGAPLENAKDVSGALRERQELGAGQGPEPVVVAWDGNAPRVPFHGVHASVSARLKLEDGSVIGDLRIAGRSKRSRSIELPRRLPPGYHRLDVEADGTHFDARVISAPQVIPPNPHAPQWGVFLPLYALASERSQGVGDLRDLEELALWAAGLGAGFVGTLPLLAAFLGEPFDPSPYAPASRLFWNELYLDLAAIPELRHSPYTAAVFDSDAFRSEAAELRGAKHVDYCAVATLKRKPLERLARSFFDGPGAKLPEYREFLRDNPRAMDYARFRAAGERQRAGWKDWPEPLRSGTLRKGDYDDDRERYHLFAQFAVQRQLRGVADRAAQAGARLYLDLPLGVHAGSYDVWRERALFADGISTGAPPDTLFTGGQDWGFPPLNPEAMRREGHRYFAECIRTHLRYAGTLRLDHVMSLHRLYWVPHGLGAKHGVYVRYPAEELYAVLTLEASRRGAQIVGEDLGTVPREVRTEMGRHNVIRMTVVQFDLSTDPARALPPVPKGALASVNTHDMPPFAAFWQGLDIRDRRSLGLLDDAGVEREWRYREQQKAALIKFLERGGWLREPPEPAAVLNGCLAFLADSPAELLSVNLEDLWEEASPQNVPGTSNEQRPNWSRRGRYALEQLRELPQVLTVLRAINELRR